MRLLVARARKLGPALRAAKRSGHAFAVIDGTLICIDRVAVYRRFYSGKHRKHEMNLQVISSPGGQVLWVSGALPGSAHDLTAPRIWGILPELAAAILADKGYIGAGGYVATPYRGLNKPTSQKDANQAHVQLRVLDERANAQLKTWRILRKLRCCPWRTGQLAKAIHVLQTAGPQDEKAHCNRWFSVDLAYGSVACSVSDERVCSGSGGLVNLLTREEKEHIIDSRGRCGLGSRHGEFCRGCLLRAVRSRSLSTCS